MPRTPETEHAQWTALARSRGLPDPPRRPETGTCCTRGCDPCIWDYYERALGRWRERHELDAARIEAPAVSSGAPAPL